MLHELGTQSLAATWGPSCHEMGVMLLALLPCLYCDVSDVWRLQSKWQTNGRLGSGYDRRTGHRSRGTYPLVAHRTRTSTHLAVGTGDYLLDQHPGRECQSTFALRWLLSAFRPAWRYRISRAASGLWGERLRDWLLGQPHTPDPLISTRQRRRLANLCRGSDESTA